MGTYQLAALPEMLAGLGMPLHGGKQLVDLGYGAFASGHEVVGLPGMKKTGQHTAEDAVPSSAVAARS